MLDSPDLLPTASGQLDFLPQVQWPGSVSFLPIHYVQLEETACPSLDSLEQQADVSVLRPACSPELFPASQSVPRFALAPAETLPTVPSMPIAAGMAAPAALLQPLTAANLELLEQAHMQQQQKLDCIQQQMAGTVQGAGLPAIAGSIWHRFWASMPKLNASQLALAAQSASAEAGAEATGGDGGMNGGDDDPGGAGGANRYELIEALGRPMSLASCKAYC